MKVIKAGRKQTGWAAEIECSGNGNGGGGCGALLLVEQFDLFTTVRYCRDETDTYVTFKCSECGVLTDTDKYKGLAHRLPSKEYWERDNLK